MPLISLVARAIGSSALSPLGARQVSRSFSEREPRGFVGGRISKACPMSNAPTVAPPAPDSLNSSLLRNIEALRERRLREEASASLDERIAARITQFTGSMRFVLVHAILYGFWIVANLGWLGLTPWDPTFVVLAMIASVEAIFLSTFILISQNRMAVTADRRAELDVQVSLLTEHEITKLVQLVSDIASKLEIPHDERGEIEELKRTVAPEAVLDAIERSEEAGR
jgi:uncharacterized membrane protein